MVDLIKPSDRQTVNKHYENYTFHKVEVQVYSLFFHRASCAAIWFPAFSHPIRTMKSWSL